MSSTYTSLFIIPGRRAGNINQIINECGTCKLPKQLQKCKICRCPTDINSKIVKNSNPDVIPGTTQRERAVNAIKYGRGGKTIFGNAGYRSNGDTLLGQLQGQPVSPMISRNRF
jgi:hypothetical protein